MRGLVALAVLAACPASVAPASAQVIYPPSAAAIDAQARADAATAKASADAAIARSIPTPALSPPPSVADASSMGNMTTQYALANHTHASKARKGRVLVPANGQYAVTLASAMGSAPLCAVTAEATSGDTNVVNAQVDGVTTTTGFNIRITRTAQSVVALLGLTILSVPTQVATYAHYICVEI